jgi:hypothetical protein
VEDIVWRAVPDETVSVSVAPSEHGAASVVAVFQAIALSVAASRALNVVTTAPASAHSMARVSREGQR